MKSPPAAPTRLTGRSPYAFAFGFACCGLLAGLANFLCGRPWSHHLLAHRCGEIYRVRTTDPGLAANREPPAARELHPGLTCALPRPGGARVAAARAARPADPEILKRCGEILIAQGKLQSGVESYLAYLQLLSLIHISEPTRPY